MQGYFRARRKQHVGQASISLGTLRTSVPILIPPQDEQSRIVAELGRYLEQLDEAERAVQTSLLRLADYRKLSILSGVDGTLVPNEAELAQDNARSFEPAKLLLQRIVDEYKGRAMAHPEEKRYRSSREAREILASSLVTGLPPIPTGWVWAQVGQLGEVTLGRQRAPQHHSGPYMRPYLRVANVFEDRIDTSDVLEMNFSPEEYKLFALQYGDILLNEGQSPELVGRPAMYRDELPGACFQNTLLRFRAYHGISSTYALIVFRSYFHNGRFRQIAKWSTNLAHLGHHRFANLEFPLPPLVEQERIVVEVDRRLTMTQELQQTMHSILDRIASLRHAVFARAFRGELVLQDPNEMATALSSVTTGSPLANPEIFFSRSKKENPIMRTQLATPPVYKTLVEILEDAHEPLTPEELWEKSGIGEDLIDEFFFELKRSHSAGLITQIRSESGTVRLQIAKDNTQ
jgi:type I restriction enzyme S subunit